MNSINQVLNVSQVNSYIMSIISKDEILSNVTVSGEISNFKRHSSSHLYFTLKDERSLIRCVMFRGNASKLDFIPQDGNKVIIRGYVSVFEKNGAYQLYANHISLEGSGDLYKKFEMLKGKLEKKGYFRNEIKKKLPYLPNAIGVITSDTGAVIKDITNVLDRRFDTYNLMLYPSRVQGNNAYIEIIKGIEYFNNSKLVDVIILARGGGSIEDLWTFNEELLADTIYSSEIPIISAIGHDTDYTISDFVSDYRSPTPSAAAEIVLPNKNEIINFIIDYYKRLNNSYLSNITRKQEKINEYINRPVLKRPEEYINIIQMNLDLLVEKYKSTIENIVNDYEKKFLGLTNRFEALSPLATLNRGYAIIEKTNKEIITSINEVAIDDNINIKLKDGTVIGKVIDKECASSVHII